MNIDTPTLSYFIECCGTDMQDLINEIRKLIEYVGQGRTITKDDIDKLSIKKMESIIFIEQLSDQFFMMFLTEKYIPIKNILKCFNQIVNM